MIASIYQGKNILVTGASGFIGHNLVKGLSNVDCTVIRMFRPKHASPMIKGKFKVIDLPCDLRKPINWQKILPGIDFIFHLASQTSETIASQDPLTDLKINVFPIVTLLKACEITKTKPTILFASSFTVVGLPRKLPIDESLPDNPITIYDLHKNIIERYLHLYSQKGIINSVALRLGYVYGPGQQGNTTRGILNMMINRALKGKDLTIYGSGNYLRDYIYIDDVISAFLEAGRKISKLNGESPIIGTGSGHTIKEAFKTISLEGEKKTNKKIATTYPKSFPKLSLMDKGNFVAKSNYFSKITGWQVKVSLKDGINRTMDNILNEKK